jgi:hypothetical protein
MNETIGNLLYYQDPNNISAINVIERYREHEHHMQLNPKPKQITLPIVIFLDCLAVRIVY